MKRKSCVMNCSTLFRASYQILTVKRKKRYFYWTVQFLVKNERPLDEPARSVNESFEESLNLFNPTAKTAEPFGNTFLADFT